MNSNEWADKVISDTDKNLWLRVTHLPVWSTKSFDPYNYLGRQIIDDPNHLRNKVITAVRAGSNKDEFVTIHTNESALSPRMRGIINDMERGRNRA